MLPWLHRSRILLAALLVLGAARGAQQERRVEDLHRARQRWAQLSPREQDDLRANYRRYLALSEEQRAELRRRALSTKESLARLHGSLPQEARDELARLDPKKRHEVLRDMLEAEADEVGRRIRSKMPEDVLAKLERAEPVERPALLRRFQEQQRTRVARGAIELLGAELGLPEPEIRRRQELPADERAQCVLSMRREVQGRQGDATGLPSGLTWERWEEWSRLPPEAFFERMMEFRAGRMRALGSAPTPAAPTVLPPGPQIDPPPGPPGDPPPRSQADQPQRVLRRLSAALQPDPRDALELVELSRPERRRGMVERRRERCMQLMLGERLLPPARMAELEGLPDEAFFDFVRQMLRHSGYLDAAPAEPR